MKGDGIEAAEAPDHELGAGAAPPHAPAYRGAEAAEAAAEEVEHVGHVIFASRLHGSN